MAGPAFADRDGFPGYVTKPYADVRTIYGDMCRLVVAQITNPEPRDLQAIRTELGWSGSANVRAIHDTAVAWMAQHRPK